MIMALVCAGSAVGAADTHAPGDSVKETINAVLDVLRNPELSSPDKKQLRREEITALIRERFNFREMARRSLARHWKKRTPEEREKFISLFSDILVNSYIGRIEGYTNEKVTFDKAVIRGKGKYGKVSTTIVAKDVDIPIDYKVILLGEKWWVYDVVVEGVSFISTYRSQYNKIIVRGSYGALIKKMKARLAEITSS